MARVHLAWGRFDEAHALLLWLAAEVTGLDGWRLTHACGQCGSSVHGRPVLVGHADAPHVSLSRAERRSLVALCTEAPVGVDLERAGAAKALTGMPEVDGDEDPTRAWVRTEARLKALGTGFTRRTSLRDEADVELVDLEPDSLPPGEDWCASVALSPPRAGRAGGCG